MAVKILIIDPNAEWLGKAAEFFESHLYEVDIAPNGKDAQLKMFNNQYFATILNLDVQNHSGLTVMSYIKANKPCSNVVLTMNTDKVEEEVLDLRDLARLGAQDYLVHPFELDELKEYLEGKQSMNQLMSTLPKREGQSDEVEVSAEDDKFTAIKINEFTSAKNVLFDIFIKLKSGRYVKILHAGDSFSKERIEKYKNDKNVSHLYFLTSDRRKYIRYCNFLTAKLIKNDKIPADLKLSMMKNATEKLVEDLYQDGVKPVVMDQAKKVCENMYDTIKGDQGLYKLLRSYQDFDPNAFSHSYLICLFGSMIIQQFEWESKMTQETLGMAAMLHDIGKVKIPKEIVEKRPEDMDDNELEWYYQHPELGVELLETNRLVSPSVKQIIRQHHEYNNGTGFPLGIKDSKILTLAKILCVADDFTHELVKQDQPPIVVLKKMLADSDNVRRYHSVVLEKFIQVFVDPKKKENEKKSLPTNSKMVSSKKAS